MQQYHDHSRLILSDEFSGYKPNRTGVDTISRFGGYQEYDLSQGFPLMTTKRMGIKTIATELTWFMRGDSNIKYLVDNGVHIWDDNAFEHYNKKNGKIPMRSTEWFTARNEFIDRIRTDDVFAEQHGDLNDLYGKQWRAGKWVEIVDGREKVVEIDQLGDVLNALKNSPNSRRMILTAWNPGQVPHMALPPCHMTYQFNVQDGRLDVKMDQRSADTFLGVPFNIASAAMLNYAVAQTVGLKPGRFIHTFGDAHFYCGTHERGAWYGENLPWFKQQVAAITEREGYKTFLDMLNEKLPAEQEGDKGQDHVTGVLEQLSREPRELPTLTVAQKPLEELTGSDFILSPDYNPHPAIKRAMAA